MEPLRFVVAPGVEPEPGCREALEAARSAMPDAALLAAVVPGDEAWPRILDKEEAIDACRHGLVALRAVQPGAMLVRGAPPRSLAETAALLAQGRGALVPGARAVRRAGAPRPGSLARLRLLAAPHFTRDERLWQLFRLLRR
ncbi:MAG TPA: hypothetical protein VHF89_04285 [Solirubrobacteraceae bacterium]|nr:hypothetical protein [Solirubrobacteraceae bacterium]